MDSTGATLRDIDGEAARLGRLDWARQTSGWSDESQRPISSDAVTWLVGDELSAPTALLAELSALELVDETGALTEVAISARVTLDPTESGSLSLVRRNSAGTASLRFGMDSRSAIMLHATVAGEWAIRYRTSEEALVDVFDWLPLVPQWSFDVGIHDLAIDDFEALILAPADPDRGVSVEEAIRAAAWDHWIIQSGGSGVMEFVQVDGWGVFAVEREESRIALHPVVPGDLAVVIIADLAAQIWGDPARGDVIEHQ